MNKDMILATAEGHTESCAARVSTQLCGDADLREAQQTAVNFWNEWKIEVRAAVETDSKRSRPKHARSEIC